MSSDLGSENRPKYRITLERVNNRQLSKETPFRREPARHPITPEYLKKIKGEIEAAGIEKSNPAFSFDRMIAELEAGIAHYFSAKKATQITPKALRDKHAAASAAIEKAISACDEYQEIVSRSGQTLDEIQQLIRDAAGLKNLRQHMRKDGLALEGLPERMPKTFHEAALASHLYAAIGAVGPDGMCATAGGLYENVLTIVLELVGARLSDPHRLAIKIMDEHPVKWVGRGGRETERGKEAV